MATLLQRVLATIERYRMFAPGQRIGVAVSGGADSVCLLELLRELAPRWNLCLSVIHLDHGLRGEESRADAETVRDLAAAAGLPFLLRRADLATANGNLEQNARNARLALYRELISAGQVDRVALGHTKSDQAETVLFRFLRGSATAGLAGILPVTAQGVVRPLIEVDRPEVEAFLTSRGISWREDSSNRDPQFARNRIRHQLLPQLAREWNPAVRETLAHTADWALAEEQYWSGELDRLESGRLAMENGAALLNVPALRELPLAAARRLIRRAMERAAGGTRRVDFAHVEAILRLAGNRAGRGGLQAPGLDVRRSFDWIRLAPGREPRGAGYRLPAPVPGAVAIPGSDRVVSLELVEKPETSPSSYCVYNGEVHCLDWSRVSGALELRSWMPGDRIRRPGATGPHRIKTLFQLAGIPLWERDRWPVLTDQNAIVWTRRFGAAAHVAAGVGTRLILRVRETGA